MNGNEIRTVVILLFMAPVFFIGIASILLPLKIWGACDRIIKMEAEQKRTNELLKKFLENLTAE